jgi:hypothetical protein
MTVGEFCEAVAHVGQKYGGSITSWGRSVQHSIAVGGFNGDPHTWWLGADMVYDGGVSPVGSDAYAASLGLHVIHEGTHDHYQPIGWVNHPKEMTHASS